MQQCFEVTLHADYQKDFFRQVKADIKVCISCKKKIATAVRWIGPDRRVGAMVCSYSHKGHRHRDLYLPSRTTAVFVRDVTVLDCFCCCCFWCLCLFSAGLACFFCRCIFFLLSFFVSVGPACFQYLCLFLLSLFVFFCRCLFRLSLFVFVVFV